MFKVWSKVEAMPYLWHSFAQLVQDVKHIAAAKAQRTIPSPTRTASYLATATTTIGEKPSGG
jgi:hypothetical protein